MDRNLILNLLAATETALEFLDGQIDMITDPDGDWDAAQIPNRAAWVHMELAEAYEAANKAFDVTETEAA